ncbi:unnamed protein product [Rhizoctonia solani]|uniref:Uncharacterized protein n=1 Tax=Rhizoctonia solani TaxID=456999 RepID=A0A8H3CA75_9AGAM|nr:unnamed protein product [Rhizoctonia solani]
MAFWIFFGCAPSLNIQRNNDWTTNLRPHRHPRYYLGTLMHRQPDEIWVYSGFCFSLKSPLSDSRPPLKRLVHCVFERLQRTFLRLDNQHFSTTLVRVGRTPDIAGDEHMRLERELDECTNLIAPAARWPHARVHTFEMHVFLHSTGTPKIPELSESMGFGEWLV